MSNTDFAKQVVVGKWRGTRASSPIWSTCIREFHRDPDVDWEYWGAADPYYGVLTTDEYRLDRLHRNRAAFFRTGEVYVSDLLSRIDSHFGSVPNEAALDFGCGVGRLLVPLAAHFRAIEGVDISPGMIKEARMNCGCAEVTNVSFKLLPEWLSSQSKEFSLINSFLVFQHIPVRPGLAIIEMLTERLALGGILALHISTKRNLPILQELAYLFRIYVPGGNAFLSLLTGAARIEPPMLASQYPLDKVLGILYRHGCRDVLVTAQEHGPITNMILLSRREKILHPATAGLRL